MKEFADYNFKFDENGRKFSKWVGKTLWKKREIARYEQFLLFPQCFQRTCTADMQKPGLVWERVNPERRSLLKTLLEKEKMLVTSIFSFSPQFFIFQRQNLSSEIALTLSQTSPGFYVSAVQVF